MENKRRIFRIVTALIALAVVATMCVLLVACDPEGKKGGETAAGGGDAIFTEGVTLAELTEKLNAAESFTLSQYYSNVDERLGDDTCVYKFAIRMMSFQSETQYFGDDKNSILTTNYENYTYVQGEWVYSAARDYENTIYAEKSSLTHNVDEYFESVISGTIEYCLGYIVEKDGKIVFNEAWGSTQEDYVAGSGYVRLGGTSVEIGYKESGGDGISEVRYVISDVNATTVTIPDYIKAAEKDAVWQEEF